MRESSRKLNAQSGKVYLTHLLSPHSDWLFAATEENVTSWRRTLGWVRPSLIETGNRARRNQKLLAVDPKQVPWEHMSDFLPTKAVPIPSAPIADRSTEARGARLDSWKEIAGYLSRGTRTVQRWEREAGLPVHRLQHEKLGSVYAWPAELDAWWRGRGSQLEQQPAVALAVSHSIAVLPFADMSQQQDQQYFCEGIAEEITHRLAGIKALRVVSRTSSFQVRALTSDLRELGRRLRVGTVLEGSVRKAGDRLRITVQLADVESGFHRWSGSFDRELSDIFAIQDEIAHSVVEALEVDLSTKESATLHVLPTANLRAYDSYLRARQS